MRDLKCGMRDCRFNKGYNCMAKSISVDKFTDCVSYERSQQKQNSKLFEAGAEFAAPNTHVDTHVGCDADCLFQKQCKCIANGITVMGEGENQAACLTFIKK